MIAKVRLRSYLCEVIVRMSCGLLSWRSNVSGLYPEIEPFDSGRLAVDGVHEVYYEQSGSPDGKPVLFVHGGPGGGTHPTHRRYFDPEAYRIILFDQRGCGQSTPHAELRNNTTWDLVQDMEKLRQHLDIEAWQLFGGSWGSTLSLAYAQTHPEHVLQMVLRGIFLLRRRELLWYYQDGASRIFPDEFEKFMAPIAKSERGELMSAYYKRLTSEDAAVRLRAAKAWSIWEGSTSRLLPDEALIAKTGEDKFAEAFARIECHYFVNGGFFEEDGQLLRNVERIHRIPAVIVQGRYDVVCPAESAYQLHQAWPKSKLEIVADAGHSALEDGIVARLVAATDRFRGA